MSVIRGDIIRSLISTSKSLVLSSPGFMFRFFVRESVICLIGTMEVIAKEIRKLMTKLTRKPLRVNLPELIVPISDRRKLMEAPIIRPIFLSAAFPSVISLFGIAVVMAGMALHSYGSLAVKTNRNKLEKKGF